MKKYTGYTPAILFPAIHMIDMGTQYTGQVINIEIPLGLAILLFYIILGFYLWKKKDADTPKVENKEVLRSYTDICRNIRRKYKQEC